MTEEKISVIIPVYNVEAYIKGCLDSVIHQTYHNLEIIVVNDGSTDRSYSICKHMASNDDRISFYSQQNKGAAATRNFAIKKATGNYLFFVDADDVIDPEMIQILYQKLQFYHADIMCSPCTEFEEKTYGTFQDGKVDQIQFMKVFFEDRIKSYMAGKLYRKEMFEGIILPTDMKVEDYAIMHHVFHKANVIAKTNQKFYYYNQENPNSETKTKLDIIGLYPRAYYSIKRYIFCEKYYPQFCNQMLKMCLDYSVVCYLKMILEKNKYKDELNYLKNFIKEHKKKIKQCPSLSKLQQFEINEISKNHNFRCCLLGRAHILKQKIEKEKY